MAGRGTDIVLGGSLQAEYAKLPEHASIDEIEAIRVAWQKRHEDAKAAGGLRIIGSERHESRRIDNQLRGRAGRQGDPGGTRFYLSLEDNLMRIFASDRISGIMRRLGMKPGEVIVHPLITKAIENAQRKLEGHYFDIRKQLLSFDNVANEQRKVIYAQRAALLEMDDITEALDEMCVRVVQRLVNTYIPLQSYEDQWQIAELEQVLKEEFFFDVNIKAMVEEDHQLMAEDIQNKVAELILVYLKQQRLSIGDPWSKVSKSIILETLDLYWREHLAALDYLRQGIHLRGYAQKDPKQEYKKESFHLFSRMLTLLEYEIISKVLSMHWQPDADMLPENDRFDDEFLVEMQHKIGRNDPCPCGSGAKYKACHGKLV